MILVIRVYSFILLYKRLKNRFVEVKIFRPANQYVSYVCNFVSSVL